MTDYRRSGDNRPLKRDPLVNLTLRPERNKPIRWLPRHGEPLCILEWLSQRGIKLLAYAPVYTALVTTAVLLVLIFGGR